MSSNELVQTDAGRNQGSQGYEQFFNSKELSDITIRYGDKSERVFYGHRVILCSKSLWFKAALLTGFKESESKEITLVGDNPDALYTMFQLMYEEPNIEALGGHARTLDKLFLILGLYEVADKYSVAKIETEAIELFSSAFSGLINEVVRAETVADIENIDMDAISSVIDQTYHLAGLTPRTRDHPLVQDVLKTITGVFEPVRMKKGSPLQSVIAYCAEQNAEFGRDLFMHGFDDTVGVGQTVPITKVPVQCHGPQMFGLSRCDYCDQGL